MRRSVFNNRWGLLLIWLLPILGAGWTVSRAPLWVEPHSLTVTLEPGQTVVLGRKALAAPQADSQHVQIRREANGDWRLINLAVNKKVLWQPAREWMDRSAREWRLTPGAAFTVGAQSFEVLDAGAGRLTLQHRRRHWEYDGFRLRLDGQWLPECYENWRAGLRERLNDLPGVRSFFQRPLRLGGGVYCANRLGLPGAPVDTAVLAPVESGFVLQPGWAGRLDGPSVMVAAGTAQAESLWRRSIPLVVDDQFIIGRTQYQVARIAPVLELTVLARAWRRLAMSPPPEASPMVVVQWQPVAWWWPPGPGSWRWPAGLGLAGLVLGQAVLYLLPGGRLSRLTRWQALGSAALAGACFGLHLSSLATPILWPYLLAWLILGMWLMTVRSLWSAGLLTLLTLLLGIGWLTLLQMGAGAEESGWPRYGGSGAALAGAFGWLAWAGSTTGCWRRWPGGLNARSIRWGGATTGGRRTDAVGVTDDVRR